jgi:low affinity Fe/Cu permease
VFRRLARGLTVRTGSATAAVLVVCGGFAWLALGVFTGFPRWWELLVTAGVPLLTFLMVVLLQHTQNHNAQAIQLKLDELIRATQGATNRMMTVEDASPEDLDRIRDDFRTQAESASRA